MRAASLLATAAVLSGCAQILGGSELDDLQPATSVIAVPDGGVTPIHGSDGGLVTSDGATPGDATPPPPPPPPPRDGGADGSDDASTDGGNDASDTGTDGPPVVDCGTLAPGDLAIVEIMVASASGSGDRGEWLEVKSTRACRLDLRGLHAESPRGALADTLDVTTDTYLDPGGTFIIADSADAADNHGLGGLVLEWSGSVSDSLKNSGDTVTLSVGGATIDSITYDATFPWITGGSLEYPAACPLASHATLSSWRLPATTYGVLYFGTPNAPNADVSCQ